MRTQAPRDYTVVEMARAFCIAAHAAVGQKRKYTGEDYHNHPEEALQILLTHCEPSIAQQVAILLHDVVEDTSVTLAHVAQVFGQEVARLVEGVTDISTPEDGNRAVRKGIDRSHVMARCDKTLELKLSDLISNTKSIARHDKKFAYVYLDEKVQLLAAMNRRMARTAIYDSAVETAFAAGKEVYVDAWTHYNVWSTHFNATDEFMSYTEFREHVYPEITDVEESSLNSESSEQDQPNV
jgi:(p)ppGpp synthase/HD superfamily hydrolase